ncbi:fanconi anemia group m protein homolog [Phtheirospermum japonicum]|uniref:Fanconi anemia group m protein homolog n=1 Tax=Phtheirospermum japonicum TaxID=374723 RepID=A0A830B1E1_9LAMI|nr:fanconi anemia group m protein homolog [Phtheirospermum japonicum]
MASSSVPLLAIDDDDGFDWEAAVQAIDVACLANVAEKPTTSISNFNSSFNHNPQNYLDPVREMQSKGKNDVKFSSVSSTRQSTLDKFVGLSSGNSKKPMGNSEFPNGSRRNVSNDDVIVDKNGGNVAEGEYIEMLNGFVNIDPEAAKTWIYPVNVPHRDYQYSITRTALFSNTLVVLPTGLGKTLIAAVVMYNFFRWFPEGKIVFAAPSRPLVLQQIEACHNIVGIPQEWTIDLTGQTNPTKRADLWKDRRVFFVTPQVFEKDIHSGSCSVKHLVCLVIDEAHRATGNYSYCVAVRELMDTSVQLRILALTATPGCKYCARKILFRADKWAGPGGTWAGKQQTIQLVIDNLRISTLEYRNESDPDVLPYVHDRKIEVIEVAMGDAAFEVNNLLLEVVHPFVARLSSLGVLQKRDFQTYSPPDFLNSRDKFRREPPQGLPQSKFGEIEGYFGVLITLYHVRKLLSSHGISPAFEMLDEKLKQGHFARLMSRNEALLKAKLLMQQTVSHGAPSPKLAKMLEVLVDHFNSPSCLELKTVSVFIASLWKNLKGAITKSTTSGFTGGYNVIVATSIGEEGLDIMEVDLVICFDANVSPLRMIQRMGRTGRKHEGRVPHVFRPEAQFLEMSIEKFVPRGKQVKDCNPVAEPAYKNKLTEAESDLLAKYFAPNGEISRRPSLIAFPHFQAFPSPIDKVVHSSRTEMLIDTMQFLQELTFSNDSKAFSAQDEDILDPFARDEIVGPRDKMMIEESSYYPVEEELKKEMIEVEEIAKDAHIEDLPKLKPCVHNTLFGSEFVSVDDVGNVLVLSLPRLPLDSACHLLHNSENHKEITEQTKGNMLEDNMFESSQGNLDWQKRKLLSGDEEIILQSPVSSRMPKELDVSYEDHNFVHETKLLTVVELSDDSTWKHDDEKSLQDKMDVPCAPRAFTSPTPVTKERQSPVAKLSNTSGSEDWLLGSGPKPETVEKQRKFRRLRKLGDLDKKVSSESKEQTGPVRKHKMSKGTDNRSPTKLIRGKKKRAMDGAVYIEEEAEVSSEGMASDNEEDEHENSSYEDSFIDDANFSPDSVVQSSRIDESATSSGPKHDETPQTGLQSTDRISQFACDENESGLDSRKRKLSYYQVQSVPMVNLDKEFSTMSETAGEKGKSCMQIQQVEKKMESIDIFDDDQFFEGIDLDAVEEEAAKLFRQKSECSARGITTLSESVQQNICFIDSAPSFDLGI